MFAKPIRVKPNAAQFWVELFTVLFVTLEFDTIVRDVSTPSLASSG